MGSEMCIRDIFCTGIYLDGPSTCLLYTSDAADDMQCVDLGGRRIIKRGGEGWWGVGVSEGRQGNHAVFFFNDPAPTEIYTLHIVGSVRCV